VTYGYWLVVMAKRHWQRATYYLPEKKIRNILYSNLYSIEMK